MTDLTVILCSPSKYDQNTKQTTAPLVRPFFPSYLPSTSNQVTLLVHLFGVHFGPRYLLTYLLTYLLPSFLPSFLPIANTREGSFARAGVVHSFAPIRYERRETRDERRTFSFFSTKSHSLDFLSSSTNFLHTCSSSNYAVSYLKKRFDLINSKRKHFNSSR